MVAMMIHTDVRVPRNYGSSGEAALLSFLIRIRNHYLAWICSVCFHDSSRGQQWSLRITFECPTVIHGIGLAAQ